MLVICSETGGRKEPGKRPENGALSVNLTETRQEEAKLKEPLKPRQAWKSH
jgi:GMP synthase-like glutamine amidotransferase